METPVISNEIWKEETANHSPYKGFNLEWFTIWNWPTADIVLHCENS